jgi:hypothetical protein
MTRFQPSQKSPNISEASRVPLEQIAIRGSVRQIYADNGEDVP